MERFILHIAKSESIHEGQIYAVSGVDEAIETIRRKALLDMDQQDQKFFEENHWCSLTSMYCDREAGDIEVQMMTVSEFKEKLAAEHKARVEEVVRLCE